ncbi:hypothetical protein SKAU_G00054350 [Synaphobranchus kaupii]|uniref:Uncharacterized protein n=1 Tax=Synaphobranchus kaupii TaxID=118154 RepID=A0A9Q1G526_SYNKA|nr:hypothetical protein SKAU_G00054350 [Synaphobranchus kaupii]
MRRVSIFLDQEGGGVGNAQPERVFSEALNAVQTCSAEVSVILGLPEYRPPPEVVGGVSRAFRRCVIGRRWF